MPESDKFFVTCPADTQINIYSSGHGQAACTQYIGQCDAKDSSSECCINPSAPFTFANALAVEVQPTDPNGPGQGECDPTEQNCSALPRDAPAPKVVYPNYGFYMDGGELVELAIPTGMHYQAMDAITSGK
jgi:hypothetical protein